MRALYRSRFKEKINNNWITKEDNIETVGQKIKQKILRSNEYIRIKKWAEYFRNL